MSIFEESGSYKPFTYNKLAEATKRHLVDMHWTEAQVDLQDDLIQYHTRDGLETKNVPHSRNKFIFDTIVCLFTELDKAVAGGYAKLISHVLNNEARSWLFAAASRETTHQRGYALAAETFGFPSDCWVTFKDYVEMTEKLEVMNGGSDPIVTKLDAAKLLARILLGEGIGLFAAFACLLNFKRSGLFMGFNDVNQWSLMDEQEHVENNMYILEKMRLDLTEEENSELDEFIFEIAIAYRDAELKFTELVFSQGNHEDLTKEELTDYVNYITMYRLNQLGLVGDVGENPLEWMDWLLSANKHDNFFEKKITSYSHEGLVGEIDYTKYQHLLDARLI